MSETSDDPSATLSLYRAKRQLGGVVTAFEREQDAVRWTAAGAPISLLLQMLDRIDSGVVNEQGPPRVDRVVIADAACDTALAGGELVLAIGLSLASPEFEALLASAAGAGCAGLVCRVGNELERRRVETLASRYQLDVFAVPTSMSWDRLTSIVRSSMALESSRLVRAHGPSSSADLFDLADSAAALLDCPIIIDDGHFQVIAYSSAGDTIDVVRRRSIADLKPPEEIVSWLDSSGLRAEIDGTDAPIAVNIPGYGPRLVTVVRAGREIIGYVWAMTADIDVDYGVMAILEEVAVRAADLIMYAGLTQDSSAGRLSLSYLLREVVLGGDPGVLSGQMSVGVDRPARLIAFGFPQHQSNSKQLRSAVHSLIAFHMDVQKREAVSVIVGDTIVILVENSPETRLPEEHKWIELIIARARRRFSAQLVVAVGSEVQDLNSLPAKVSEYREVLELADFSEVNPVQNCESVRKRLTLARLDEFMAANSELLDPRLKGLSDHDDLHGTDYLQTLYEYLRSGCDMTAAARRMFLHRNTLKYRLARIGEICAIDLEDLDERLVTQIQLRHLLRPTALRVNTANSRISG